MRWLILGAGALSGYFGGRLLEAGADITFLLRPRRLSQIRATGLIIRSRHGDAELQTPHCVLAKDIAGHYDAVMLGCKAYDLDSAMDDIAPAIGPDTAVLPLLNGLSHLDRLSARFGVGRTLGGVCFISAVLDDDGAILHLNDSHSLAYGELDGSRSTRVQAIELAFQPVNFDGHASTHILQDMWEKWIFIAAVVGATCLMRAAIGDIVQAGASDLTTGILDECTTIAAANGHAPRPAAQERMRAFVTNAHSEITASMLKDIERYAHIEGEQIVGDLIRRTNGKAAPLRLLPIVYAHLKAYELRRARELQTPRPAEQEQSPVHQ